MNPATRWIRPEKHLRALNQWREQPGSDAWYIHAVGCVRIRRTADIVEVTFDGRHFDADMCQRLVAELDRLRGLTSRFDFAVWSGAAVTDDGWLNHSVSDSRSAKVFLHRVSAAVAGTEAHPRLQTTPMRLDRLLFERRGVFDEALAAWLLDRRFGNTTIGRLFLPERERPNEGLKVVRRFGDNLVFEAYRTATGHQWIEGQQAKMPGSDLSGVLDRQLAESVKATVAYVARSGEPHLERVSGVILTSRGGRFGDYLRLTLPLEGGSSPSSDSMLIATVW